MSDRDEWQSLDLAFPDLPLERQVAHHAHSRPETIAIIAGTTRWTWRMLDREADRLAAGLQRRGLSPGDRIGWLGRNDAWIPALFVAALRTGIVPVGLNWRLHPTEQAAILDLLQPRLIVAPPDQVPPPGDDTITPGALAQDATPVPLAECLDPGRDDRPAMIFLTSGSTGLPKAVQIRRGGLHIRLRAPNAIGLTASSRLLVAAPFFHVAGWLWSAFALAGGLVQVLTPRADPAAMLDLVAAEGITHAQWLPSMLDALVGEQARRPRILSSLAMVAYGAAPLAQATLEAARTQLGCRFCQVYGLTETLGAVGHLSPSDHGRGWQADTMPTARADPDVDLAITDSQGRPLPPRAIGELRVRDRPLPAERITRDGTISLLDTAGRIPTGDLAWQDEGRYFRLVGRVDEMIITGGENVQPAEIEALLLGFAEIAEACVFGLADPRWGQRVCAAIVPQPGSAIDPQAIMSRCRDAIAHYKAPRSLLILDALPRTATGKVQRKRLAAEAGTAGLVEWLQPDASRL